jgi:hypothetical protein
MSLPSLLFSLSCSSFSSSPAFSFSRAIKPLKLTLSRRLPTSPRLTPRSPSSSCASGSVPTEPPRGSPSTLALARKMTLGRLVCILLSLALFLSSTCRAITCRTGLNSSEYLAYSLPFPPVPSILTGYHNNDNVSSPYSPAAAAASGGAGAGAVRLDTLAGRSTENLSAIAPPAPLGRGERSQSISSMATAEMSGARPMMHGSGSEGGGDEGGGGWYQVSQSLAGPNRRKEGPGRLESLTEP